MRNEYTAEERSKAQEELDKVVKEHFDAMTKRWKSEMDALLVYVRLFSLL